MFILDLLHLLWPLVLSLAIWLVIHYAFSKLPPVNHIPFSLEENEDTSVPSPLIHTSATTSQPKTSSENQSRITSLSRRFSAPTWELKRDQEDNYDHENKENETYSPPRGFFVQQLRKSKRINLPPGVPLAQPKWPRLANKGVANTVMDTQTDYIMKPISSLAEEKLGFRKMRAETAEDSGNASLRDSFSAPRSDAEEEEEMEKVEESPAEKCDYTCACDSILPSDVLLASKLTLVENDREVMELTTSIEEHSKDVKGDVQLVDNLCQIEDIESATEKNADKLLRRLTTGRNLLNKKEVAPSTIKESSESSQTIDEQDGGSAAAAAADKAALKHENVARVDTVVRVDTVGNKTTAGFQQQVTNCLTGAATGSAAPSPAPPTAGVSPRPSAHHSSALLLPAQKQEIVRVTQQLLDAISCKDFDAYARLCDPSMTCFEPETLGNLIEGMDFHKFYFDHGGGGAAVANTAAHLRKQHQIHTTLLNPNVHLMGEEGACIAYVRLTQYCDRFGDARTRQAQETRVWQKRNGRGWVCVHVHRSGDPSSSSNPAVAAFDH